VTAVVLIASGVLWVLISVLVAVGGALFGAVVFAAVGAVVFALLESETRTSKRTPHA
jgi:hypothetical protein